jgi:glycosyltransferase involved in cell wall biosynthesis
MKIVDLGVALDSPGKVSEMGNSSQKTGQYLACGVPVIGLLPGNEFLEECNVGWTVRAGDQEGFTAAVASWLALDDLSRYYMSLRVREYAVEYLSVKQTTDKRLSLWTRHCGR